MNRPISLRDIWRREKSIGLVIFKNEGARSVGLFPMSDIVTEKKKTNKRVKEKNKI